MTKRDINFLFLKCHIKCEIAENYVVIAKYYCYFILLERHVICEDERNKIIIIKYCLDFLLQTSCKE